MCLDDSAAPPQKNLPCWSCTQAVCTPPHQTVIPAAPLAALTTTATTTARCCPSAAWLALSVQIHTEPAYCTGSVCACWRRWRASCHPSTTQACHAALAWSLAMYHERWPTSRLLLAGSRARC